MTIRLICGNQELVTTFEQAQSILQIQREMKGAGTSWQLDSNEYEFKDNGIIKRENKTVSNRKATPKGDRKGDKAPAETEISHADDTE